jgi:NAD(P)-dependent dehydrogenase (short-subunit alcohol dehydrogenase family)
MSKIRPRAALITGGSTGIGLSIARVLAKEGLNITITSRDVNKLTNVVKHKDFKNITVVPMELELLSKESINEVIQKSIDKFGGLDVLVNNAATPLIKPAINVSWDDWDIVVNSNLKGSYFMSTLFADHCITKKKNGSIINISSTHGLVGLSGRAVYGISKGGMIQMTRMLAIEWAKDNIRVNTISPATVMTESRQKSLDHSARKNMLNRIPLGQFPEDVDVADAALFLVNSKNITGQNIAVDGGLTAI